MKEQNSKSQIEQLWCEFESTPKSEWTFNVAATSWWTNKICTGLASTEPNNTAENSSASNAGALCLIVRNIYEIEPQKYVE